MCYNALKGRRQNECHWQGTTKHVYTYAKHRLEKRKKKGFFVNKGNQNIDIHSCSWGWMTKCISVLLLCFSWITHPVALAIVVAWVRVKCTQMHPTKTHFILSIIEEATDIGPGLWRRALGWLHMFIRSLLILAAGCFWLRAGCDLWPCGWPLIDHYSWLLGDGCLCKSTSSEDHSLHVPHSVIRVYGQ